MGIRGLLRTRLALVSAALLFFLGDFHGTTAFAADVTSDHVSLVGVSEGSGLPNRGTLEISSLANGLNTVELGFQLCRNETCFIISREFLSVCSRFQMENNVSSYFGRTSLIGDRNFSGGKIAWVDATHLNYSIDEAGLYKFSVVRVQTDGSYCGGSKVSANLVLDAPKALNADSPSWVQDSAPYTFKFSSNCAFDYDEAKPGEKKTCSYSTTSNPKVEGTVPVEYLLSTNGGPSKVVGKSSATIGETTQVALTVPTGKTISKVAFDVRIAGSQKVDYLVFANVIQKPDPSTLLNVTISGPSRVIRGTAFKLIFKSTPRVTGSCLLTSYPEASGWGDLGTVRLQNGTASKTVKLLWPQRLGDGFTVGVSLKCNIGKRSSFNTYGAMGYLP